MIKITNELKLNKKILKKRYIFSKGIKVAYSFYSVLFYFGTTERDIFKYQNKSYAFDLFITGGCNIRSNSSKQDIYKQLSSRMIGGISYRLSKQTFKTNVILLIYNSVYMYD